MKAHFGFVHAHWATLLPVVHAWSILGQMGATWRGVECNGKGVGTSGCAVPDRAARRQWMQQGTVEMCACGCVVCCKIKGNALWTLRVWTATTRCNGEVETVDPWTNGVVNLLMNPGDWPGLCIGLGLSRLSVQWDRMC